MLSWRKYSKGFAVRLFFTSDTHFFHRNIIKYCQRPFASPEEMNRAIISIWNRQVQKGERVYHLGDVSFGGLAETYRVLAELNGEICLLRGNHDDALADDPYLRERFVWIKDYHELNWNGRRIVLCHYPLAQWRDAQRGAWHLYGHTHGSIALPGAALDVGIDAQPEFRLWTQEEIIRRLSHKAALPYPGKPHYPQRRFDQDWQLLSQEDTPSC